MVRDDPRLPIVPPAPRILRRVLPGAGRRRVARGRCCRWRLSLSVT